MVRKVEGIGDWRIESSKNQSGDVETSAAFLLRDINDFARRYTSLFQIYHLNDANHNP
jgi:hypothetical protein